MSTAHTIEPDPRDLLVPASGTVLNRTAQPVREGQREVVRLDARPGEGVQQHMVQYIAHPEFP